LRRLGLEWLWRLLREPRRLGRQLAIPRFVLAVQREARRRVQESPK
jgi:N-acetylglucosaminyldiphosphoundecaprenol N-acetyl-beta-D-mannosaminyltransferase